MNKKIFFVLVVLTLKSLISFAQANNPTYYKNSAETRRTYIGPALGLNYSGLIGVQFEQNFGGKGSFVAGAGIGSWGYKLTAGGRYYISVPSGKSVVGKGFGASFGLATGLSKVQLNLETTSGSKQEINVQLSPMSLLNLTYFNNWKLGNGASRFGLEFGYSVPLNSGDNFKVLDNGVVLSSTSVKVLRILQPGGIIFGISFTFGS
jgi:hypothetical protein